MSLNLLSLDAHFPKTKYFPATGFATDLRVDHQTVKDTCHFWATHGNTKLGFIYMRWIFTECTMEFIIKPRFGRVLFNFFPSSTIYLEKKLLGGLGWWLGFLGSSSLESQNTNPNHQFCIKVESLRLDHVVFRGSVRNRWIPVWSSGFWNVSKFHDQCREESRVCAWYGTGRVNGTQTATDADTEAPLNYAHRCT